MVENLFATAAYPFQLSDIDFMFSSDNISFMPQIMSKTEIIALVQFQLHLRQLQIRYSYI